MVRKTATAEQQAQSAAFLQDPDTGPSLISLAEVKPSVVLEGPEPRLLDEWQMAPQLWDAVRFQIDRGRGKGRFILTGSATPKKRPQHTGVGRIARMHMRPMSLFESRESEGLVSLALLFEGAVIEEAFVPVELEQLAFALCRGGWPEAVLEPDPEIALDQAKNYVSELLDSDIDELGDKKRNSTWIRAILRSYARTVSTEASQTTIAADMQGGAPFWEHGSRLSGCAEENLRHRRFGCLESGSSFKNRRANQPHAPLLRSQHRRCALRNIPSRAACRFQHLRAPLRVPLRSRFACVRVRYERRRLPLSR